MEAQALERDTERSLQEALDRLPLRYAVKKALAEFVRRLHEAEGNNLLRVVLFGSMARGDYNDESDTDVFVLLREGKRAEKNRVSDIAVETAYDTAFNDPDNVEEWYTLLSPFVRTEAELKQEIMGKEAWLIEPVFVAIREEGIPLFEKSIDREEVYR